MIPRYKYTSLFVLIVTVCAVTSACGGAAPPEQDGDTQSLPQDGPPTADLDTMELDEESLQQAPVDFTPSKDKCPGLEHVLVQLSEAEEPARFAAQRKLTMKDNAVQVVIQLSTEDTTVLDKFGIEVDSHSGKVIQAYVPVTVLCDLARDPNVIVVRTPDQAIIQ